jgi:GNAT superfamily N-acetyltransferase
MTTATIHTMSRADLDTALSWAEAEGWNPGVGDAAAFLSADPGGFLVAEISGEPVASLSIVRFGNETAFLGLYICRPEHRGQGIGYALWQAGMERLALKTTGLDGVPAQQPNYARSGFVLSHPSFRFTGTLTAGGPDLTEPLTSTEVGAAISFDRAVTGFDRAAFMQAWLTGDPSRKARVLRRDGSLAALGVLRTCVSGCKIGPLFAQDLASAEAMLDGLAHEAKGKTVSIDIPAPNAAAIAMADARGLTADFETARMWRGPAPAQDLRRTFGVTTFELG